MPPYGKTVARTPPGYWDRGTRVVIFAGPRAWAFAKPWLEVETLQIPQARHRYTLVLPPDATKVATSLSWPVSGRAVVIVRCGISEADCASLIDAVQRDGCLDGEMVAIEDLIGGPLGFEHGLRCLQPWSWATWDGEVMAAYRLAQLEDSMAPVMRLAEFMPWLSLENWPASSIGAELTRRLALRERAEAA